ncbi:hypothetical protein [Streptomyces sp. AS02]|uniref:hypothetical protein n=1 Tax=Streptomyces sp. AS02 TaxID=2938946 RepID=UPI00202004BC|nr:hypothetical protein [Streptomyces sp. AS02]MCL8013070.1 hypothetical protein [Streptomyces sp. AS02]
MPFGVMFSSAISAGTVGFAEGALAAFVACTRHGSPSPYMRSTPVSRWTRPASRSAAGLRDAGQVVRALRGYVGGSFRLGQPFQPFQPFQRYRRYRRDVHAAMNHLCKVADSAPPPSDA